jgi:cyclophilin family peptidyl-prolyl cis-trans isomerase
MTSRSTETPRRRLASARGVALAAGMVLALGACSSAASPLPTIGPASAGTGASCPTSQPPALAAGETRTVDIKTALGSLQIKVEADLGPLAAGNFVALASCGYYDSIVFHRVVPGFVIQGGDPRGDGNGGPGYTIRCELTERPFGRGAVGMALSGRDTGGSQFFITVAPTPHLDGEYTLFGRVANGMDVVDRVRPGDVIDRVEVWDGH